MRCLLAFVLSLGLLANAGSTLSAAVLKSPERGSVALQGIDVIRFAPEGVLLIADGKGNQIVAVDTQDTAPLSGAGANVKNIGEEIAARLGSKPADVEVIDLVVNPLSTKAYLAIRKHDEKRDLIVTVDPNGKLGLLALDNVPHVRVGLPRDDKGAPSLRITDLAWANDRLVAAARANEEFASKLLIVPGPLSSKSTSESYSAETFHVAHNKWETKAPMSSIMPYEENGQWYVVGAFSCTPIVKYPLAELQVGAKVKGISMIGLGSGNRPLNMFSYEKDGKPSVLVNTFRFHHARAPLSPSPYWTCRFNRELLADQRKINEQAVRRDVKNPADAAITMVDAFGGVVHMDRLDAQRALVIRNGAAEKQLDLATVVLP